LRLTKFAFGGITPFSSTSTVLIKAAMPLAPSRWPMLLFSAPLLKDEFRYSRHTEP
jgi:hypothetical protein